MLESQQLVTCKSEYEVASRGSMHTETSYSWESARGCVNSDSSVSATPMPLRASHSPSPVCLEPVAMKLPAPLSNGFEPAADVVLRPSALHLAEKVFKKLMKLKKKAMLSGSSCFLFDPSQVVKDEIRPRRCRNSLELDVDRSYDSDEHSAGFVGVGDQAETPTSSSSMRSSSFESVAPSSTGPPAYPSVSHTPGSQMMANLLLSLTALDDGDDLEADDNDADSEDDEQFFDGPRESAWHQPEEEILFEQEWRMTHCGHLQGKSATKPNSRTDSADQKFLAMAGLINFKQMSSGIQHSSFTTGSKRETRNTCR